MTNATVYLCGPIDNCSDNECFGWRLEAAALLGAARVLDPTRREYRDRVHDLTDGEVDDLVGADLRDLRNAAAVIANCWKAGWGTPMEMVYARLYRKPLVAVAAGRVSPWVRFHSDAVVPSVAAACDWAKAKLRWR